MKNLFALAAALLLSLSAFSQVAVPEEEVSKSLLDLIVNFKTLGPIGIGSAVIIILTQILKSDFFGSVFKSVSPLVKRAIIVILSVIYGVLFQVGSGVSWAAALMTALFSWGGAVSIWETIKPLVEKK